MDCIGGRSLRCSFVVISIEAPLIVSVSCSNRRSLYPLCLYCRLRGYLWLPIWLMHD
jgi:hypothetical protein